MRSLLIVIKEEYLSKGIALALMDYFQSIHTTKNPYEAIEILDNEKIDIIISELDFKTIKPNDYFEKLVIYSQNVNSIVILKETDFNMIDFKPEPKIIVEEKPISIPKIIELIKILNKKYLKLKRGE